jgi:plasminogen activator inhibitor 1 RNA-binding protein
LSVPFFLHYEGLKIWHFLRSSLYYCCLQGDDKGKLKKKEMEKEKEERARKVVSINEFLKPAEGDKYHGSGGGRGHGRGEGRGDRRGNFAAGGGSYNAHNVSAPHIEDPGQFPTLGGK